MRAERTSRAPLLLFLMAALLFPALVYGEAKLTVSGQMRVRAEMDKKDLDPSASPYEWNDLRTRLGVEGLVDGNTHVFVQLEDSRRLGGVTSSGEMVSGTTTDGKNVDMHQAYVWIERLGMEGLGLKAGRFEVEHGNGRVFGLNDWSNVGRTWEGASLGYKASAVKVTGYVLKRLEPSAKKGTRDFDIFGLYGQIPKAGLDLFGFYERDGELVGGTGDLADLNALDRVDVGLYGKRAFGAADVEVNAVYQTGKQAAKGPLREQDIGAYLATAEVGYKLPVAVKARLALGADVSSGDDDPADDTYEAYTGSYARVHRFRGYMEYFREYKAEGLLDLMARASVEPCAGFALKADAHYFQTMVDYVDWEGEETKSGGIELDLTATTTKVAGVKIDGGASVFFPSDSFAHEYWEANKLPAADETDPGLWAYLMLTAGFGETIK